MAGRDLARRRAPYPERAATRGAPLRIWSIVGRRRPPVEWTIPTLVGDLASPLALS